ncbi:cysteine--tRNA ligase [Lacticaseibacillus suilingensis]|jgi:cysteinyl-tRNA synthetase|uniref:Cysteine--tRNA ligase n=1 Tax=Lacticaseibacillus suilingensis TaxID=2799577 RepID=A0ABW4BDI9_9LACO|nr:cysteine--tRNA ligase [Lacticaseibacillus suilingensis]MCI1895097.1 cysteine--tRNA ligase [Lactobacillus sp.]MCI1917549.1 cysteine--tRNA ligase [Lactobacillus sp.]MCI1972990.1 cysteine--tRNA ligase [Lactobacillus sp.]MCI2017180.1 cysteine--tRNA ligase [Lactobacillus sp.]MCI2037541.1 cysteine--tRNA ligase [Lactobacillus sp.]
MLQLYNTLTRQKEPFTPIKPGEISMYVCGPTVYNYIHIGNARSAIAFDTIRRYFEYRGYKVNYVSNFTDVDDKIINAAHETGEAPLDLAQRFIDAFMADTGKLNIEPATAHPRASQMIPEIISFVERLMAKGYAYESEGDVYYRARKFKHYGELANKNVDELEQGASQHVADAETARKEDPIDFALWKAAKPGEIAWDSPWGQGRPGWHIECSVMSTTLLGDTIDIHGGGQDLEFPHHENEIAQSEAATGKKFVNYWMHNGFVTIGEADEKMSKSLGNFITVHDIVKTVDPQTLRFLMASTQYRRPIRYSEAGLKEAARNLERLKIAREAVAYRQQGAQPGSSAEVTAQLASLKGAFIAAMDDDINVQNGLAVVYDLAKLMNEVAGADTVYADTLQALLDVQAQWLAIFGVQFQAELLDADVEALIEKRNAARAAKDFALSDQIRDDLQAKGILLDDTAQGTRWRRK